MKNAMTIENLIQNFIDRHNVGKRTMKIRKNISHIQMPTQKIDMLISANAYIKRQMDGRANQRVREQ